MHGLSRTNTIIHRYTSLLPEAWILTDPSSPHHPHKSILLAQALNLPHKIKPAQPISLLAHLRSWWSNQHNSILPRLVIADSPQCLPYLRQIQRQSQNRVLTTYWGLPKGRLDKVDILVLSRLDQMRLRALGPARANLENAVSTLVPFSGGTSKDKASGGVAVCVGRGSEPSGYGLTAADTEVLLRGLQLIPGKPPISLLLHHSIHRRARRRILTSPAIDKLENLTVLDYSQKTADHVLADPHEVLGSASQVIATADDVESVALAVSLGKPAYVAGQERTTGVLRNYYRLLDTRNLVRRFYPAGSPHSYLVRSEITGAPDPFSAIRDHQPWAPYDSRGDLNSIVSFIQRKLR